MLYAAHVHITCLLYSTDINVLLLGKYILSNINSYNIQFEYLLVLVCIILTRHIDMKPTGKSYSIFIKSTDSSFRKIRYSFTFNEEKKQKLLN